MGVGASCWAGVGVPRCDRVVDVLGSTGAGLMAVARRRASGTCLKEWSDSGGCWLACLGAVFVGAAGIVSAGKRLPGGVSGSVASRIFDAEVL